MLEKYKEIIRYYQQWDAGLVDILARNSQGGFELTDLLALEKHCTVLWDGYVAGEVDIQTYSKVLSGLEGVEKAIGKDSHIYNIGAWMKMRSDFAAAIKGGHDENWRGVDEKQARDGIDRRASRLQARILGELHQQKIVANVRADLHSCPAGNALTR